eukprot:1152698-Prymnesium_polylepis.1
MGGGGRRDVCSTCGSERAARGASGSPAAGGRCGSAAWRRAPTRRPSRGGSTTPSGAPYSR